MMTIGNIISFMLIPSFGLFMGSLLIIGLTRSGESKKEHYRNVALGMCCPFACLAAAIVGLNKVGLFIRSIVEFKLW